MGRRTGAYSLSVLRKEGGRQLGRLRRRGEKNIKMGLRFL